MNKNVKAALIIGGVIVALMIIVPLGFGLISGWQYGGWGMMGPGMMGGFGTMWLMPVFWILILGLVIWAAAALVRGLSEPKGTSTSRAHSALDILKRRYAEGEISKEEYEDKKKDLT